MNQLETIQHNCQDLAELRAKLRRKFEARQKEINAVAKVHDPDILALQGECNLARAAIEANLAVGRHLFAKPKTREFFGVVVGFEKAHDTITMPDDAVLIDRIEKTLKASVAETVLDRTVRIIKAAFKKLPRPDLQKLGCNIVTGADEAVIRTKDDDIETLVQKSLGQSPQN